MKFLEDRFSRSSRATIEGMSESDTAEEELLEDDQPIPVGVEDPLLIRFQTNMQMATTIMFLGTRDAFQLVQEPHEGIFGDGRTHLPETFTLFETQIHQAALITAFAHFEAYLGDMASSIYRERPRKLSGKKELKVDVILTVIESGREDAVLDALIDHELRGVLAKSLDEVFTYFKERFQIDLPEPYRKVAIQASMIRNVIMHRGGIADKNMPFINTRAGESLNLTGRDTVRYCLSLLGAGESIWTIKNKGSE